jgi:hypothetical protein
MIVAEKSFGETRQSDETRAGLLPVLRILGRRLGLSESQWDGVRFYSSTPYQTVLTHVEVLDSRGQIVRREVPHQSPTQGLRPGDLQIGKRNHTGFSKLLFGLRMSLLPLIFWRRLASSFKS